MSNMIAAASALADGLVAAAFWPLAALLHGIFGSTAPAGVCVHRYTGSNAETSPISIDGAPDSHRFAEFAASLADGTGEETERFERTSPKSAKPDCTTTFADTPATITTAQARATCHRLLHARHITISGLMFVIGSTCSQLETRKEKSLKLRFSSMIDIQILDVFVWTPDTASAIAENDHLRPAGVGGHHNLHLCNSSRSRQIHRPSIVRPLPRGTSRWRRIRPQIKHEHIGVVDHRIRGNTDRPVHSGSQRYLWRSRGGNFRDRNLQRAQQRNPPAETAVHQELLKKESLDRVPTATLCGRLATADRREFAKNADRSSVCAYAMQGAILDSAREEGGEEGTDKNMCHAISGMLPVFDARTLRHAP